MRPKTDWLPAVMKGLSAVRAEPLIPLSASPAAQNLFDEIVSTPVPARTSAPTSTRWPLPLASKMRVAVAASVGLLLVGTAAAGGYALFDRYGPTSDELRVQGRVANPATLEVRRSIVVPAGVTWTVVSYDSSDGVCLDAFGELSSGGEQAKLGGCDLAGEVPYSMGGLQLGDEWFNVIFGQSSGATVRVTLGSGAIRQDTPENGVWIVVVPSDPTARANDFARVDVLDGAGNVVATIEPPSLAQLRQDAQQAPPVPGD